MPCLKLQLESLGIDLIDIDRLWLILIDSLLSLENICKKFNKYRTPYLTEKNIYRLIYHLNKNDPIHFCEKITSYFDDSFVESINNKVLLFQCNESLFRLAQNHRKHLFSTSHERYRKETESQNNLNNSDLWSIPEMVKIIECYLDNDIQSILSFKLTCKTLYKIVDENNIIQNALHFNIESESVCKNKTCKDRMSCGRKMNPYTVTHYLSNQSFSSALNIEEKEIENIITIYRFYCSDHYSGCVESLCSNYENRNDYLISFDSKTKMCIKNILEKRSYCMSCNTFDPCSCAESIVDIKKLKYIATNKIIDINIKYPKIFEYICRKIFVHTMLHSFLSSISKNGKVNLNFALDEKRHERISQIIINREDIIKRKEEYFEKIRKMVPYVVQN